MIPPHEIDWSCHAFPALPAWLLYRVLALRSAVFIVEQNCVYQDLDDHDAQAWFLVGCPRSLDAQQSPGGRDGQRADRQPVLAHARLFAPGIRYPEASIGRVCTAASVRGMGLGRRLMAEAIRRSEGLFGPVPIRISAQAHLADFYAGFGFAVDSEPYDEDGIPHIEMQRPARG